MLCRLLGHRYRFAAEGATMTWHCERGCGAHGSKSYATPARARRLAAALDREDRDDVGRRAPFIGLFPLRLWHRWRARNERTQR